MKLYKDKYFFSLSISAILISLIIYWITKAPTLSFWDCGEFIAASYIMGVPHPPGYPMYIILGRFISMLPISPDIAVRVNLLSVFGATASVFVAYWLILRVVVGWREKISEGLGKIGAGIGAFTGSIIMGFSYTFWANAVEAEVYTISMFLMLLVNYLAFHWAHDNARHGRDRTILLISYLMWFSLGIHMTTFILMLPMVVYMAYTDYVENGFRRWPVWAVMALFILYAVPLQIEISRLLGIDLARYELESFFVLFIMALVITSLVALIKNIKRSKSARVWTLAAMTMIFAALGYSTVAYIPIRAAHNPNINENDPSNWSRYKGFMERKQYGQESMIRRMFRRRGSWTNQLVSDPRFGLWANFSYQYASPAAKITFSDTNQPDDRRSGGTEFSLALPMLFVIVGLYGIYEASKRAPPEGIFLFATLILCNIGLAIYMNFSDGSYNTTIAPIAEVRNRDYFYTPGFMYFAVMIGIGMAYFLRWLGNRATSSGTHGYLVRAIFALAVIAAVGMSAQTVSANFTHNDRRGNFLPRDYAYNILNSCGRDAILFTNGDNDTFPLWYLQEVEKIRTDVRVVNLSLLNTPWYIHQLKNQMDVPITLRDNEIDSLRVYLLPNREGLWRVQDQMIQHIVTNIHKESWKIPVYFAITVPSSNRLGLDDHLIMEGMTYRIVESSGDNRVNTGVGYKIFTVAENFRGIDDPSVEKDDNDRRLVTNYIVAMLQLADAYQKEGHIDSATYIAEMAVKLQTQIGFWQAKAYLARIYAASHRFDKILDLARDSSEGEKIFLAASQDLIRNAKYEAAVDLLELTLQEYPFSFTALNNLAAIYHQNGDTAAVDSLIAKFRLNNIDDLNMMTTLDQLVERLNQLPQLLKR